MFHRSVKIIATIGPATVDPEKLKSLIHAGANVFRFNFAHGAREEQAKLIRTVHSLSNELNIPVGTLADISGPKIRLGKLENEPVNLEAGEKVKLSSSELKDDIIPVQLEQFHEYVHPDDPIYLSDGTRKLVVESVKDGIVTARVETGGEISSYKGINLPFLRKPLPLVGKKDLLDIEAALDVDIDWIGLSFVGKSADIDPLHDIMKRKKKHRPIVAKLERRLALDNLDEIVQVFDGVMVARGDLGIEVDFEKVPVIQDRILSKAHEYGKPAIVATQILTSMISNPRPTRAEVTDIAYAISSGADALMLSEETAIGQFPEEAVKTIVKVAKQTTEPVIFTRDLDFDPIRALARTAVILAENTSASAILCPTHSGKAARAVARFYPKAPIMVVTDVRELIGELTLYHSIYPAFRELGDSLDTRIDAVVGYAMEMGLGNRGDKLVIVGGVPAGSGRTNLLMMHEVE